MGIFTFYGMDMSYRKPSEELLELLEESLIEVPFVRKKMFGQYAFFLNGNMFAGVFEDSVFIRYPPEQQDSLKEMYDEISNFEPLKGRPMREYVVIPDAIFSDDEVRFNLLETCVQFALQLPPK
ncbi:MAG: hypothetical protein GF411_19010 [Candidatus Lokiarchaeota archaeon]|nr:hypothetical protein [Candidatus Lokiarchaeota archaeon]